MNASRVLAGVLVLALSAVAIVPSLLPSASREAGATPSAVATAAPTATTAPADVATHGDPTAAPAGSPAASAAAVPDTPATVLLRVADHSDLMLIDSVAHHHVAWTSFDGTFSQRDPAVDGATFKLSPRQYEVSAWTVISEPGPNGASEPSGRCATTLDLPSGTRREVTLVVRLGRRCLLTADADPATPSARATAGASTQ